MSTHTKFNNRGQLLLSSKSHRLHDNDKLKLSWNRLAYRPHLHIGFLRWHFKNQATGKDGVGIEVSCILHLLYLLLCNRSFDNEIAGRLWLSTIFVKVMMTINYKRHHNKDLHPYLR